MTYSSVMVFRASIVLLPVGLVVSLSAWAWSRTGPDANIGAGLLVFLGIALMAVGTVGLLIVAARRAIQKRVRD